MNKLKAKEKIERFLIEDIGDIDATSEAIFPQTQQGQGVFIAKADGIVAGLSLIEMTYHLLEPRIVVKRHKNDGEKVSTGDIIAEVTGPVLSLLTGERTILNLIQRMSGIASLTHLSVQALNDQNIQICDTRKTTPGLAMFEKYAVTKGGGKNHRRGLYDGIMIKDNHIAFAGSITQAVQGARAKTGHMVKIEVETETEGQVKEAVEAGADVIMFDNRSPEEVRRFVDLVPKHIVTEASGGITLERLSTYQKTGVNYISLGYLTHSVTALDISLNVRAK